MTESTADQPVSAAALESPGGQRGSGVPAVRLSALRRDYGDVTAVDGLDVEVGDGEFFSLIGPSGCGKTTTLRMIAGLVLPTEGRIEVHGRDVTYLPPHKRPVNTVFQNYALFPHLDVYENIAFGLREHKVGGDEIGRRVGEMVALVGLEGRERNRPSQLSGGQQQRVALARSLVLRPEVLLLDEPLGALDLKLRKQLQLQLKRIQNEVGITFIYVTHDQEEAFFMSNRVAIMSDGRIEQMGTPRDVYERPQTEFVADFVGSSNRMPAVITACHPDGSYEAELEGVGTVRASGVAGLPPGGGACAIVRPEAISPRPASPGSVGISGHIRDLAYLGHHVSCEIETTTGSHLSMNVSEPRVALAVGDRHEVSWPVQAIWLLGTAGSPNDSP